MNDKHAHQRRATKTTKTSVTVTAPGTSRAEVSAIPKRMITPPSLQILPPQKKVRERSDLTVQQPDANITSPTKHILVVTEKAALAKLFVCVLAGAGEVKIVETVKDHPYYSFAGRFMDVAASIVVTSVKGKLYDAMQNARAEPRTLVQAAEFMNEETRFGPKNLKLVAQLKQLAKSKTDLGLWTDPDMYGEAIAGQI